MQNCATRLFTGNFTYTHVTPILRILNLLPFEKRIIFKILLLTYKGLHNIAPIYTSSETQGQLVGAGRIQKNMLFCDLWQELEENPKSEDEWLSQVVRWFPWHVPDS